VTGLSAGIGKPLACSPLTIKIVGYALESGRKDQTAFALLFAQEERRRNLTYKEMLFGKLLKSRTPLPTGSLYLTAQEFRGTKQFRTIFVAKIKQDFGQLSLQVLRKYSMSDRPANDCEMVCPATCWRCPRVFLSKPMEAISN
jgi:hypothetical protein